jgi:hypothetical protein
MLQVYLRQFVIYKTNELNFQLRVYKKEKKSFEVMCLEVLTMPPQNRTCPSEQI